MEETITITKKEYESLKEDSKFLEALRAGGVDSWCGYDYACEMVFLPYTNEVEDENG